MSSTLIISVYFYVIFFWFVLKRSGAKKSTVICWIIYRTQEGIDWLILNSVRFKWQLNVLQIHQIKKKKGYLIKYEEFVGSSFISLFEIKSFVSRYFYVKGYRKRVHQQFVLCTECQFFVFLGRNFASLKLLAK